MPKGRCFTASFGNGNADRRTGCEICHNRRRVKKNTGNPKEKIALVQTEIKKWDCPFSDRMITRQLYEKIQQDKKPSEKMLEDLQKIGITAGRIEKISNLKK